VRKAQAGVQRHRAALGKTGEHDVFGRYAELVLGFDQCKQDARRIREARFVLAMHEIQPFNVIPGAHDHAGIDGHRAHRRVRKQKAHRPVLRQIELRDNRIEIPAVGAQPVQPDHRMPRIMTGFSFQEFDFRFHASCLTGSVFRRMRGEKEKIVVLAKSQSTQRE
jgi:hypothetical protein